tara:strand:+ start:73 stop:177 length:105 start_codon:yes stop_codon:yes gene_type:complete
MKKAFGPFFIGLIWREKASFDDASQAPAFDSNPN